MAIISPSEIVSISVSNPPAGLAPYSVNNLLAITDETPVVALDKAYAIYTNPTDVGAQWGTDSDTYKAALSVFAQSPNILSGNGKFIVAPLLTDEDEDDAVSRIIPLVYFGGVGFTYSDIAKADALAVAAVCQANRKKFFFASKTAADLVSGGTLFGFKDMSLSRARGLFHSVEAMVQPFQWAYAGRGQSTQFSGVATASTMHLKQLSTVESDDGLNSTILNDAKVAGADVYASVAGRPSLLTSGANEFYDDVYNLDAFVSDLEVAGFNALAQAGTKVPQTEAGMSLLKGSYRAVCEKYLANGFIGAGEWTGTGTFGDPEDFRRNIRERGYYIYSLPLAQQTQADREDRKASLVHIAIKYQGAIHSTSVVVAINR